MTRTFTVVGPTTSGSQKEDNQIFADDLNIAESPARVDIDKRTNSKGDNDGNILDRIMNESDDSSSGHTSDSKGKAKNDQAGESDASKDDEPKEFNEDDDISEKEK